MRPNRAFVGQGLVLGAITAASVSLGLLVPDADGYNRYNDGCNQCHGDFTEGMSPQGTVFPGDDKHLMHRNSSYMNAACDLCHTDGDGRNPFIGSSNGTASSPGVGCTGCHGHDYGGGIGNSGIGLRDHHRINDVSCAPCHDGDGASMPENVSPVYYGVTADSNVDDPCNSSGAENWSIGDTLGLDNDGDNDYDGADDDCQDCVMTADQDGDGCVAFNDINQVLANWGTSGPTGDSNCNGVVEFGDILPILAEWGMGPNCP